MNQEQENMAFSLNLLTVWKGNVRKTAAEAGLDELCASIEAHGLISPLAVMKEGKKVVVVAGQRRLMALQRLAEKGIIAANHPVDCRMIDNAHALEISLAENAVRTDMHPADQFEAWRTLTEHGMTPADIAARFGVSDKTVARRLKLGRVAPPLLDLYRAGTLSLEQIEAFTVSDDHAEQLRVWDSLSKQRSWYQEPDNIREALTEGEIAATDKRVRFIGLDAYEAAGGPVRRDLFDNENAGWVLDAELLNRMVSEKLEAVAEEVRAEGWKWVEIREEFDWREEQKFGRDRGKAVPLTPDEKATLSALESEMQSLEEIDDEGGLTDEQDARADEIRELIERIEDRPLTFAKAALKRSGAVITLGREGPDITRGLIRKEDVPKPKPGEGDDEEENADVQPPAKEKEKSPFSAALVVDLTKEFTGALQAELASRPTLALVVLVHAAVAGYKSPSGIHFSTTSPVKGSPAEAALDKIEGAVTEGMPDMYDDELWGWLEQQSVDRLLTILAVHVARSVDAARNASTLRTSLGLDLRKWFTPTAENYFGKVAAAQIHADLKEMGRGTITPIKKPDLVSFAHNAVLKDKGLEWLPVPLRAAP